MDYSIIGRAVTRIQTRQNQKNTQYWTCVSLSPSRCSERNNFTSLEFSCTPHIFRKCFPKQKSFRNIPYSKASFISQLSFVALRCLLVASKKTSLPRHFSLAPMLKVSSTTFVNQKDENWLWDGCAAMLISSQFPSSFTSILPATQAPAIINRSGKHIESICYSYSANSLSFIEFSQLDKHPEKVSEIMFIPCFLCHAMAPFFYKGIRTLFFVMVAC